MRREAALAMPQRADEVLFHRADGNAEARRYRGDRDAMHPMLDENLSAAWAEFRERLIQGGDRLFRLEVRAARRWRRGNLIRRDASQ